MVATAIAAEEAMVTIVAVITATAAKKYQSTYN
jgi:hypothetical protein